jgi:hypothetical protein
MAEWSLLSGASRYRHAIRRAVSTCKLLMIGEIGHRFV